MLPAETIAVCAESWMRMTKCADGMSSTLDSVKDKMTPSRGFGVAGKVQGLPTVHAPSIKGVSKPHAMPAPTLGFPKTPKIPTRL